MASQTEPDEAYEKFECPYKSLTDVGKYCYTALCAVSLNKLYQQEECDRKFVERTIESLVKHLEQPPQVLKSALSLTDSVTIDDESAFINSIKKEEVIKEHGISVIPKDLVLVALKDGGYDSRMRTLIKFVSLLLQVDFDTIETYEQFVVKTFREEQHEISEEEAEEKASKEKTRKIRKYALIGVATVSGGALLGLTGGLAAPLIAAGAGALIGGAGAAALGSTAGIAVIGSLFGVAGAGLGGYKMNKRVGDVQEFAFEPLSEGSELQVTIAVSGWITDDCPDFCYPWRGLANSKEQYALRYESKYLKEMGGAMDYLFKAAVTQATSEALKYTVLSGLMAAIAWPAAVLGAASVIDNPWSVMTQRSMTAGRQLGEVLLSRQQGRRPVTLIGFSLGARVIFYCLQEMAKRKNCEGIVEDVVLLGAPVPASDADWRVLRRVVAGKIVNGYCRGDWLLKFLYRTASVQYSIAGLQAIEWRDRRMQNIDLSDLLAGHMDYMNKLDDILDIIGIKTKPRPAEKQTADSLKLWVDANRSRAKRRIVESQSDDTVVSRVDRTKSFMTSCSTDPNLSKTAKAFREELDKESVIQKSEGSGGSVRRLSGSWGVESTDIDTTSVGGNTGSTDIDTTSVEGNTGSTDIDTTSVGGNTGSAGISTTSVGGNTGSAGISTTSVEGNAEPAEIGTTSVKSITQPEDIGAASVKSNTEQPVIGTTSVEDTTASTDIGTTAVKNNTESTVIDTTSVESNTESTVIGTTSEESNLEPTDIDPTSVESNTMSLISNPESSKIDSESTIRQQISGKVRCEPEDSSDEGSHISVVANGTENNFATEHSNSNGEPTCKNQDAEFAQVPERIPETQRENTMPEVEKPVSKLDINREVSVRDTEKTDNKPEDTENADESTCHEAISDTVRSQSGIVQGKDSGVGVETSRKLHQNHSHLHGGAGMVPECGAASHVTCDSQVASRMPYESQMPSHVSRVSQSSGYVPSHAEFESQKNSHTTSGPHNRGHKQSDARNASPLRDVGNPSVTEWTTVDAEPSETQVAKIDEVTPLRNGDVVECDDIDAAVIAAGVDAAQSAVDN